MIPVSGMYTLKDSLLFGHFSCSNSFFLGAGVMLREHLRGSIMLRVLTVFSSKHLLQPSIITSGLKLISTLDFSTWLVGSLVR